MPPSSLNGKNPNKINNALRKNGMTRHHKVPEIIDSDQGISSPGHHGEAWSRPFDEDDDSECELCPMVCDLLWAASFEVDQDQALEFFLMKAPLDLGPVIEMFMRSSRLSSSITADESRRTDILSLSGLWYLARASPTTLPYFYSPKPGYSSAGVRL